MESFKSELTIISLKDDLSKVELPLMQSKLSAGFPSPAEEYEEGKLDLNEYLIDHPAATFCVRITGDSMKDAGILEGSVVIVDRSLEAQHKDIIVAVLNGELTIKRLYHLGGQVMLTPENNDYAPIEVTEDDSFSIWGVVTGMVHRFK
ncbi:MAG: translesion error-prone DNA polymerase V autoproteolytic subunit [Pseudomonadota bacterium]|nr:LexA family transcriptional regulator [Pseudomonadota bacterium]QKK05614.1 MAG: translesion error-prone DNA polymerase V autoproteolytic subunit [Pseudomonadota bacterium]